MLQVWKPISQSLSSSFFPLEVPCFVFPRYSPCDGSIAHAVEFLPDKLPYMLHIMLTHMEVLHGLHTRQEVVSAQRRSGPDKSIHTHGRRHDGKQDKR